ncbi:hypothetical protein [Nocardia sp. NPDC051832]|uniref:hypothetical protein n=1 Tax=Nocardia sp. NPDC051832 TaxID=3155673 RepID=UPI00343F560B
MRLTAGIIGLLIAVAGAVMMCFAYMAQHDLRDESARLTRNLGWSCQANRDRPEVQECTWGYWDSPTNRTAGEDIRPTQERTGELISNVVLIGAALFVGGLVLTGGALASAGRSPATPVAAPPQQPYAAAAAPWHGPS